MSIVTLVRKEDGSTCFLQVSKTGRAYIYGTPLYVEEGKPVPVYYETRFPLEKYQIFEGIRHDLAEKWNNYDKERRKWDDDYKEAFRQFESEARKRAYDQILQWRQDHPRPEPPKP